MSKYLSNTETPKYYGEFREKVLNGEIEVNKEISMQMNRIDALIADPKFYYDPAPVEGYIRFCEGELTLTDGSNMELLPTFKLWAEDLLGWFYFVNMSVYVPGKDGMAGHYENRCVKKRLVRKQYLIVARGAAKSCYGETIHGYYLTVEPSATHQIAVAPVMKQAEAVLAPLKTAILRSRGPLFKLLTSGTNHNTTGSNASKVQLVASKKGIENNLTGSLLEVRPWSVDKLQGLDQKVATVDEWLSGETREDPIGALEQGATKNANDDYIIIACSSEGTVRNGTGDTIKMELMKILRGEYYNPHTSIWWYKLDDVREVGDPSKWIKAQPNIGRTVSYEAYQLDVERAEKNPSARNDILAKRFGIPMEGHVFFFTYEEIQPHPKREYWGLPCAMGADLSQGDDFCSFMFLFPNGNGTFGLRSRNYITEDTLMKLPPAMRLKYDNFIAEGSLIVMPGTILNLMDVYDELDSYICQNELDVRCFGFDPYNAKEFVERWCRENTAFGVDKVIQGSKTESVPLGEIKKLAENRMLTFDEEIMVFAMGNAIVIEDNNKNRKLAKRKRENKIDPVSALLDAFIAYKRNTEAFE